MFKFDNVIWNKGQIPADWKNYVIMPAPKQYKNVAYLNSYRPITLTSVLCKVLKKIISTRLRWWMEDKGLSNKFQSCFSKYRRSKDRIIRLTDDIRKAINNNGDTLTNLPQPGKVI